MSRLMIKVLILGALLAVLFTLQGLVPPPEAFSFSRHGPPWLLFAVIYTYGACLALWGEKTVGMIHPTSYRWVYLVGGVLLMLLILSLVLYGREHHLN